jgi:hypothetical protein
MEKLKQVYGSCRKLALQLRKKHVGAHDTIFATGPLVPRYATESHIFKMSHTVFTYHVCLHPVVSLDKNVKTRNISVYTTLKFIYFIL